MAVAEVDGSNPRYPYKPPFPLTVMVNPEVEPLGAETLLINEGCLSIPDLRGDVERHLAIRLRYLDRGGERREQVVEGLTAGTFQHEVDHLDGVLIVDRADSRSLSYLGAVRAPWARGFPRADRALREAAWVSSYWCELAWCGGEEAETGVVVETQGDRITA